MDNEYVVITDGELTHWGIKGMKWGIRRYQTRDGSLTPAGRKRYNKDMEELKEREKAIKSRERTKARIDKIEAKRAELDAREDALKEKKKSADKETYKKKNKTFKDMTDEELREEANRMILERNYLDAKKNLENATPKHVSAGEKFMKGLVDDVVVPAAKNVGKSWLEKTLKDKFGLNEKDSIEKLKKDVEKIKLKQELKRLKNKDDTDDGLTTYEERLKKENYRKAKEDVDSGKEAMARYREMAESRWDKNSDSGKAAIDNYMKRKAKDLGLDFDEDEDDV